MCGEKKMDVESWERENGKWGGKKKNERKEGITEGQQEGKDEERKGNERVGRGEG